MLKKIACLCALFCSATLALNAQCTPFIEILWADDYEDGNLDDYTSSSPLLWESSAFDPINGSRSLRTIPGTDPSVFKRLISRQTVSHVGERDTEWRFQVSMGAPLVGINNFYVYLMGDREDPSSNGNGYALGINTFITGNSQLTLFRITNGTFLPLLQSPFAWDGFTPIGVEVTRRDAGEFEFSLDTNGGFDNLVSQGTVTDTNHDDKTFVSIEYFNLNPALNGSFSLDDFTVTNVFCLGTYYSQSSGNASDPIWADSPTGTPQAIPFNKQINLIVQAGHSVIADKDLVANNLVVEAGASLDLDDQLVCIHGNVDAVGDIISSSTSELAMIGDVTQLLGGSALKDLYSLTVANPAGVMATNVQVYGEVKIESGGLNMLDPLVLKSDAVRTGGFAPLDPAVGFTGDVTLQTYVPPAPQISVVNICAPLQGVTLGDWNDDIIISGAPGSDFPLANPNVRYYREEVVGPIDEGFFPMDNLSFTLFPTDGYLVLYTGDEMEIDITGTIQRNSIFKFVSVTNSGDASADGWHLLNNPYPSKVDFNQLVADNLSTSPFLQSITSYSVFSGQENAYVSYNGQTGFGDAPQFIPSGQSFWVKVESGIGFGAVLTFNEEHKANPDGGFFRNGQENAKLDLVLSNESKTDRAILGFYEGATPDYERDLDVRKLKSGQTDISIISTTGEALKIQSSFWTSVAQSYPVHITAAAGAYTLSVEDFDFIPTDVCVSLEDVETGEVYPLSDGFLMAVDFPADIDEVRYRIHTSPVVESLVEANSCEENAEVEASVVSNLAGSFTYTWHDLEGNQIFQEQSASGSSMSDLEAGTYFVSIAGEGLVCDEVYKEVFIPETVVHVPAVASVWVDNLLDVGSLELDVEGATQFTYTVYRDGLLVAEGESAAAVTLPLLSGYYDVTLTTDCQTFNEIYFHDQDGVGVDEELLLEIDPLSQLTAQFSQGELWLSNQGELLEDVSWTLQDLSGKQVASSQRATIPSGQTTLSIPALSQGLYLLSFVLEDAQRTQKIVVQP